LQNNKWCQEDFPLIQNIIQTLTVPTKPLQLTGYCGIKILQNKNRSTFFKAIECTTLDVDEFAILILFWIFKTIGFLLHFCICFNESQNHYSALLQNRYLWTSLQSTISANIQKVQIAIFHCVVLNFEVFWMTLIIIKNFK
jgi:hypothetical protein